LVIFKGGVLVDETISSNAKVVTKNGIHVESVIPANFFSYSGPSSAKVTGVLFLKLKGSRRHLAVDVEIGGRPKVRAADPTSTRALQTESVGDQKSAFTVDVELKKNDFGGDANVATNAMISGFNVVATAIGFAAVMVL
jgi:hypothetical protein